ncbi:hypothetical protein OOU_Y34scaffold00467g16 [Pyricularia oryzae Y34]|uniref:Uncharacterized protein n=1 Tax=Pyricularia oryzae (strain Y34) TaxID=1143189 RepID=A0AA97P0Z1_PYRO3|nr:hypothetical protein OOU_Y34scaffold00467g16 [Pyricularia oryzae Y34]
MCKRGCVSYKKQNEIQSTKVLKLNPFLNKTHNRANDGGKDDITDNAGKEVEVNHPRPKFQILDRLSLYLICLAVGAEHQLGVVKVASGWAVDHEDALVNVLQDNAEILLPVVVLHIVARAGVDADIGKTASQSDKELGNADF